MRQTASYFEGKTPILVYIAKRLREATRLERTFDAAGMDYGVEADEYIGGAVFRTTRIGAFFYVLPEMVEAAHEIMRQNDFKPYTDPQPTSTPVELPPPQPE